VLNRIKIRATPYRIKTAKAVPRFVPRLWLNFLKIIVIPESKERRILSQKTLTTKHHPFLTILIQKSI
jgi:hypothetical protein